MLPGWLQDPDVPPEPPKPRTTDWRIAVPWFASACGAVMLIQGLEAVVREDNVLARHPLLLLRALSVRAPLSIVLLTAGFLSLQKRALGLQLTASVLCLLAFCVLGPTGVWVAVGAKGALTVLGMLITLLVCLLAPESPPVLPSAGLAHAALQPHPLPLKDCKGD
ncbi:hypothetical protein V8C86DRAFT_2732389 [Haematococcus lacustris]|nr:hypothetical protein QJQ45_010558 [Haematococcus lacustris]